jgi:hypothetical protein
MLLDSPLLSRPEAAPRGRRVIAQSRYSLGPGFSVGGVDSNYRSTTGLSLIQHDY